MKENNNYPFPFFGAGHAEYYEWASITIRFEKEPSKGDMKKIIKLAPEPIKPDEECFRGRMMDVLSEMYVNMWIEEEYGDPESEVEEEDDPEFYASDAAKEAFETAIETWIMEVHSFCPIEFVYRGEDGEAGGTELSDWHTNSVSSIQQLIEKWTTDVASTHQSEEEKDFFADAARSILEFAAIDSNKLNEQLARIIYPEKEIQELLAAGNIDGVQAYLENLKATSPDQYESTLEIIEELFESLCTDNEFEMIYKLHPLFHKETVQGQYFGQFIYAAYLAKDTTLIRETFNQVKNPCAMAHNIGFFVHGHLFPEKKWEDAIQLFSLALQLDTGSCKELELYCNALYVCQHDNTGLPINKELNEKFLTKCLPYAPKNPAIYFNAACLYVEMNDFVNTLDCIRLAKKHKYDGFQAMMKDISTGEIFTEFLQYPAFKEWNKK